jgi:hypothetical protein
VQDGQTQRVDRLVFVGGDEALTVRIPLGVEEGMVLRVPGRGSVPTMALVTRDRATWSNVEDN